MSSFLTNRPNPNTPPYLVVLSSLYVVNVIFWPTPNPRKNDVIYKQPLTSIFVTSFWVTSFGLPKPPYKCDVINKQPLTSIFVTSFLNDLNSWQWLLASLVVHNMASPRSPQKSTATMLFYFCITLLVHAFYFQHLLSVSQFQFLQFVHTSYQ